MKKARRIISTILSVIFVLTSITAAPVFAVDFPDLTTEDNAYIAVDVLSKLGVINGYDDGTFKPDNNVTRAEFTAMLLRTRGMGTLGSTSIENPPFPDVTTSDVSWAIGNIRTAQGMGIINGYEDGTFRPKNNVSYEEAIKMIVCALGYENYGVDGAAWYSKYVTTATMLGFLNNSGGSIGTPATRATIAKMLYNCLEVKLAENNEETDKTILENDLKLTRKVGYIASNSVTSLSTPDSRLRENEIEINAPTDDGKAYSTLIYKVENAEEYKDMFGAQIDFYYKEDKNADVRTVIMARTKNSETITINARNIEPSRCSANVIEYYRDDKASRTTDAKIDNNAIVIYNDKLYGNSDLTSLYSTYYGEKTLPTVGSIKLLDRDGDSQYDIIFVDDYETYVVSNVTKSNYTIVDNLLRKGMVNNTIQLDATAPNTTINFVMSDGTNTTFDSIGAGTVISVKKSNPANGGESYITVEVATSKDSYVSGTIRSTVSGESVSINGKSYEFSYQSPWKNGTSMITGLNEPVMEDNGRFYLDRDGNIIAYDKKEVKSNQHIGYLKNVKVDSDAINGDTNYLNVVMLDSGTAKRYKAHPEIKVNNTPCLSNSDLENALDDTATPTYTRTPASGDSNVSQLIKFTTTTYKNEEVVDNIITQTTSATGGEVTNTDLKLYTTHDATVASRYYSSKLYNGVANDSNPYVNIGPNTKILRIPANRDGSGSDVYKKLTTGDLNTTNNYYVEFYDVSTTTTASVVLVYEGSSATLAVSETSPLVVVTELPQQYFDSPEGNQYKIVGYDARNRREFAEWMSPTSSDVCKTVRKGDVIRLGTGSDGYYTLNASGIVFGVDVTRPAGAYNITEGLSDPKVPVYRAIWGSLKVVNLTDGAVVVTDQCIADTDTDTNISAYGTYLIPFTALNSAKIYRYTTSGMELDMTQIEKSEIIGTDWSHIPQTKAKNVFVYMASNQVRLMIVVE